MSASIPSWARVGASVYVIDGKVLPGTISLNPHPPEGTVVKIAGHAESDPYKRGPGLIIAGYPNVSFVYGVEMGWRIARFRPLVEDSDELGIETQLYRAKGRKSKAPARERERA